MKRSALVLVVILMFSLSFGLAQEYKGKGRIIGYVYDQDGKPLEGVKVKLFFVSAKAGFGVVTNAEGRWIASWIRGGAWNIDFDKSGYIPKQISIEVQEYGRNPEITINLDKVEGLVITEELKEELNQGNLLFEEGKYEEAIAAYQEILVQYPDAYIINKNIGNAYFQMEKYDEAEAYYRKILDKEPQNSEILLLIGNCYANRGDKEQALLWYDRIDFEKIGDPTVLYNIGTNYYNISRFEHALKYYRKAVELSPAFLDGLYQLGLTYLTMGEYQESIIVFENYLEHDPDSPRSTQVENFLDFLKKKNEAE